MEVSKDLEQLKTQIAKLEGEIRAIRDRNKIVELKKAWETSWTRKLGILLLTYLTMALVFHSLGSDEYLKNAIVPTLGFFLSTLSLPVLRKWWIERYCSE